MKLFIWDRVSNASDNYHDEGGIVAIADTLERARELIVSATDTTKPCGALSINPDLIRECEGPEIVCIHKDAGCC